MSKLDEVKAVLIAATQGLTDEEKLWAIKQAFPNEVGNFFLQNTP